MCALYYYFRGSVDGFVFDIDGKSTQLISTRNGHFHYVYMGVMMSGMIPEGGRGKGKGAGLAFIVTKEENALMLELRFRREREWSHG